MPDIRQLCGIDADTPLVIYSGAAAPQRGLGVMVEALPALPEVHVGIRRGAATVEICAEPRAIAPTELGVADRVHLVPYVPFDQVVPFLAGADIGVIPIHHWPNHEIALITKYFEYAHARLPMVVSDVRTMAQATRETGLGEVFEAENVADYARAVRAVLADPARYRAAYDAHGLLENWTWSSAGEDPRRCLPAARAEPAAASHATTRPTSA